MFFAKTKNNPQPTHNSQTFAKNKAERTGLRIHQEYKHDIGLAISIAGPKDKINVFDHVLRDFVEEINENN